MPNHPLILRSTVAAALFSMASALHVAHSAPSPIDLSQSLTEPTPTQDAQFGRAIVAADFDGDAVDDLAVGAIGQGAGQSNFSGEVTVFFTAGAPPLTLYSTQAGTAPAFGQILAAGDINNDGFGDLIVGSPRAAYAGLSIAGEVSVFFGPALTTRVELHDPVPQSSAAFGISVAAGDMNDDGFDDVVAGAWDSNFGEFYKAGEAFVFLGPSLTQVTTLRSPEPQSVGDFGVASAVGDVDGDGVGDVIVGSWLADSPGNSNHGKVFVFYGPALTASDKLTDFGAGIRLGRALATADVSGDGIDDVVAGAADGVVVFSRTGPGQFAAQAALIKDAGASLDARDTNGDGRAEVIVGAPLSDPGGVSDAGSATLLFGPSLSPEHALAVNAPEAGDQFGTSVALGSYPDGGVRAFVGATRENAGSATQAGVVHYAAIDDADGDLIVSFDDNCPALANTDQANIDAAPLANGPNLAGDDVTRVSGDTSGDACDPDDDNDGLDDAAELSAQPCTSATAPTDPLDVDSDGDHLTDGWECANGSDPSNPASKFVGSGSIDADGDRIPDLWEQRGYNASGASTDSDGDGCPDLVEIASIDGNRNVGITDQLAVARRPFGIWQPDPDQDYVLDIDKNGAVGIADRLFVARAALLSDWLPKSCP